MTSAAGMPCPVCRVGLVMSERQGVEIDYCPQCRGVWLDRGELDKIIERSAREMEPQAPPPQAQPPQHTPFDPYAKRSYADYGHDYRPKKRKKSFLEELFD